MASKYHNGLFCSPFSSISPPATDFTMARSNSRDSTSYVSHYQFSATPAYTSTPMSRNSSSQSTSRPTTAPASMSMRRSSSASSSSPTTWVMSPYRSCLTSSSEEPSSYLSDDDLLCLNIPVESIPTPERRHGNMSTEEQIDHLRRLQEDEQRESQSRRSSSTQSSKKTVRFEDASQKPRRPSHLRRRTTAVRRGLSTLNGPM